MYIITVYSKLSSKQKKKIKLFLINNFGDNNFEFESNTIIILDILEDEIIGCICLFDNKYLLDKINQYDIPLKYYSFNNNLHGCFIYNFCVHKNYRNKKIGQNLLNYTIDKMKELNIEYLHTQAENEIARLLFIKNEFIENDNFRDINNNLVYIMSKNL